VGQKVAGAFSEVCIVSPCIRDTKLSKHSIQIWLQPNIKVPRRFYASASSETQNHVKRVAKDSPSQPQGCKGFANKPST